MRISAFFAVALLVSAFAAVTSHAAVATYNDLATFQAATPSVTLVNFDTDPSNNPLAGGTALGSIYSSLGVVFPAGNDVEDGFLQPHSDPNGWINNDVVKFFDATFPSGTTGVGVFNILLAGQSTLTALDATNNVLGSVSSDNVGETLDFFGLTSTIPIASIQVTVVGDGWGLDDLYLGGALVDGTVPEPSTIALLGFGAVSLALAAWKRLPGE